MNNSEDWSHIFTPLALEQPLPELPLARLRFDLQTAKRAEENLIKSANETSSTRYLLVDNDHIAVPQHSALKARLSYELIRAIELPADYIHLLEEKVSHDVLFLGNYEGITYCVLWIHDNSNIMVALHHRYDWITVDQFSSHATSLESGLAVVAVSLVQWHMHHRFCPVCSAKTEMTAGGWEQYCPQCKTTHYPQIAPAIITAIIDRNDRLLLQHKVEWSDDPARISVCAGFVEAGESLEHAVRREAYEETGIHISSVKYQGSQPWPFPGSLMAAFIAHAQTTDIHVDQTEVEWAKWYTKDEFIADLSAEKIRLPSRASIAAAQISQWYGAPLQ